jgi:asparagine synthase (glutamine-hydrolysing)
LSFCIERNTADSILRKATFYNHDTISVWSSDNRASFYADASHICVFSGKLNNTQEITARLNLDLQTNLPELILRGFESGGTNFFDVLDGQFAIGIIEIATQKIWGIRDHFGNKCLYYQSTENGFILSDNLIDILKTYKPNINHNAIQNYFDFEQSHGMCSAETFYEGVFKVLPAHWVSVDVLGIIGQSLFWRPAIDKFTSLKPDKQAKLFKEKLINSVKKNIPAKEKICTNLSGGLDSSSVSSIAKMLGNEVNSIYFLTGQPSTDEREFANTVVQKWALDHHEIKPRDDQFAIAKQTIEVCGLPDMLFLTGNSYFEIAKKARELNCTKILTGDGGDGIVAYGNEYLEQLYNNGDWNILKESIESYVSIRDLSMYFEKWPFLPNRAKVGTYANYFVASRIKAAIKKQEVRKALRNCMMAKRYLDFNFSYLVIKIFKSILMRSFKKKENLTLLKNSVEPQDCFKFELSSLPNSFTKFQKEHFAYSFSNLNVAVTEQQNAVMESMGLESFHPFLDKDLIEVSVAVSSKTRFADGFGRGILRHAMADILTEEVRLRTSKVDFSEYMLTYFENIWNLASKEIDETHKVWSLVNKPTFDKLLKQIFDNQIPYQKKTRCIWLANRTVQLALWLNFYDKIQTQHPN